jgi:hypothetical protein
VVGDVTVTGDTFTITSSAQDDPVLLIQNTTNDSNSARLKFNKDRGAAAQDGDDIADIIFAGENDAQQAVTYAAVRVEAADVSDGSEDGTIAFQSMKAGTLSDSLKIDSGGDVGIGVSPSNPGWARNLQVHGAGNGGGLQLTDNTSGSGNNDGLSIASYQGNSYFINRENAFTVFSTNDTERFRIGSAGQLGIGGATYGTSGQVLTSGGSGAAPTWSTVSGGATSVNGLSDGYADSTNIGLGDVAFDSLSSGTNNVFLGITTGGSLDSGQSNVGVGKGALENLSTGQGNVALNFEALNSVTTSSQNIGIGRYSGRYTTGSSNIAIGEQALEGSSGSTTGNNNVCIGLQAAHSATSLYESVLIGYRAGYSATTSERPVAIGYQALYYSTGDKNVAIGVEAGKGSSSGFTGKRNVFIGDEGGASMTSGADCIFMGRQSGYDNTTGSYNICLGIGSGGDITTGSNNIVLGYNAGKGSLETGSNNICLGYNSDTIGSASSNSVTLGNSSITHLRCQEQSIQGLSDARDKEDIADLYAGLDFVDRLKPVSFTWNMRDGGKVGQKDIGFIAQDLQQVQKDTEIEIPGLVDDVNPEKLEAAYGKLLPIMVTAIQELSEKVKKLEAQLKT